MEQKQTETLAIRVPIEVKKQFLELYDSSSTGSKSELFKTLMDNFKEPTDKRETKAIENPFPHQENLINADSTEITEENLEPAFEEITIKLNPVQAFAVRETILLPYFAEETNKLVNKIDNGIDNSFFGNQLYSGDFKGIFTELDIEAQGEEAIKKNMAAALINHFISSIVFGPYDLHTKINTLILKEFLAEECRDKDCSV